MRTLAIAKPNKGYAYYRNLSNIILEARKINKKIIFYEIQKDSRKEFVIKKETVEELFTRSTRIKDLPFLKKENRLFYSVLKRNRKKYKESFQTLTQEVTRARPEVIRAKKANDNLVIRLKRK